MLRSIVNRAMRDHLKPLAWVLTFIGAFYYEVLLIKSVSTAATCETDWTLITSTRSCIQLTSSNQTWYNARKDCQAQGADLVTIETAEENENILGIIQDENKEYWIGLRVFNLTQVNWLDKEDPVIFLNWWQQERNMMGEACTTMGEISAVPGKWTDKNCDLLLPSICEKLAECERNMYGVHCEKSCSVTCKGEENACNTTTGRCLAGCVDGYIGPLCTIGAKKATSLNAIPYFLAAAVGSVILLVIVGAVLGGSQQAETSAANVEEATEKTEKTEKKTSQTKVDDQESSSGEDSEGNMDSDSDDSEEGDGDDTDGSGENSS